MVLAKEIRSFIQADHLVQFTPFGDVRLGLGNRNKNGMYRRRKTRTWKTLPQRPLEALHN